MSPTNSGISIQFLGAARTVTGSKFLIRTDDKTILVDCGLYQGLKELRLLNWESLPVDVSTIDVILLTHGHLDHTGYLPRLIKEGFSGPILGTAPTLEITKVILEDSARINEEDAKRANEEGYSKHKPAKPLYDWKDVLETLKYFHPQQPGEWIEISSNIQCKFRYNGHIIGACFIELRIEDTTLVFSSDIGREEDVLMYPPEKPEKADVLFIESTYGDRIHPLNPKEQLASVILNAHSKGGSIIIPSFAVERTQTLMYLLWQLRKENVIPDIPVYMDSPMGANVLDIFRNNLPWHKLSAEECTEMCHEIILVKTVAESQQLVISEKPKIVIAGSGMASGGRVLNYLAHYIGDQSSTILLVGYQAEGTRGRDLLDGTDKIKMFGKYFTVRAQIESIEGLSAHADQPGLIKWMDKISHMPEKIFIVHGELPSMEAFRNKITEVYHWDSIIPSMNDTIVIRKPE